jgi:hypothetical protein
MELSVINRCIWKEMELRLFRIARCNYTLMRLTERILMNMLSAVYGLFVPATLRTQFIERHGKLVRRSHRYGGDHSQDRYDRLDRTEVAQARRSESAVSRRRMLDEVHHYLEQRAEDGRQFQMNHLAAAESSANVLDSFVTSGYVFSSARGIQRAHIDVPVTIVKRRRIPVFPPHRELMSA